jgi:TATA-box binding protein (TBP) (component of TFIID and TFIIIB)
MKIYSGSNNTLVDTKHGKSKLVDDTLSKKAEQLYIEAKKFLEEHCISISTITLDCKLHTIIDLDKFAKYVILRDDEIVSVKYGNRKDPATNRTIVMLNTKKKPSTKNFYNQVTIRMKPKNNKKRNYINIKVFKNGSLQMTGCKDMNDFNDVTTTLIKILRRGENIKNKNGDETHINFINNPTDIGIYDVKIRMINSNFRVGYKIDRKKLAKILKKYHGRNTDDKELGYVEFKYGPNSGHSCVNIKYNYDGKNKPSIFVFQTGAIIITGAKNLQQIIMAYQFINKILDRYRDKIKIIELDQIMVQKEIANFFKKIEANNSL